MKTSEQLDELIKALHQFGGLVGKIRKDSKNPFFKSKYADLTAILDAIAEPMSQSGLVISQFPCEKYGLVTRLMHTSGQWMEETYYMEPVKHSPQDAGSLITYQRRYSILAVLNLNTFDDDDANAASKPAAKKQESKPVTEKSYVADDELIAYSRAIGNAFKSGKLSAEDMEMIKRKGDQIKTDIFVATEVYKVLHDKYPDVI